MRYVCRSLLLVVASLLLASSPAAAQGWGRGFFEKMSGPRFKTAYNQLPIACLWSTETDYRISPFWKTFQEMRPWDVNSRVSMEKTLVQKASHRLICLDFGYDVSENDNVDEVGLIHFRQFDGNFGFPLERWDNKLEAIEPGIGFGLGRFSDDDTTWRFTLTPYVTVKPLKFGLRKPVLEHFNVVNKRWDWRSVLQVQLALVVFTDKVSNEDIGIIAPPEPFNHRARWRLLYVIDAAELLGFR